MNKRNKQVSDDRSFGAKDNPIGLTGAFEVIRDPQAVKYDTGDVSIGLTEAFGSVSLDEDTTHSWDEAGKWSDFDWNSMPQVDEYGNLEETPETRQDAGEGDQGAASDAAAQDASDAATGEGTVPEGEAAESIAADVDPNAQVAAVPAAATGQSGRSRGKHGRHAAPDPELTPRMKKSKRTRKVLIVLLVLLVLGLGALDYFMLKTFMSSQEEAAQQAQEQAAAPKEELSGGQAVDATETAAKLTNVPVLTPLLGKTADEAVSMLGKGALITQNREVKEKGSKIKTELNVALTEEPSNSKTGTPTVYLGLNKKGKVIQVGYSAAASALGFGSLSFADAVSSEHVVEKTLAKIGVEVPEGSAVLPEDKSKYSTMSKDGKTVTKESCSFSGDTKVDGADCEWSSVLSYDYTTQNVTGNLSDTVRVIYVYLTQK